MKRASGVLIKLTRRPAPELNSSRRAVCNVLTRIKAHPATPCKIAAGGAALRMSTEFTRAKLRAQFLYSISFTTNIMKRRRHARDCRNQRDEIVLLVRRHLRRQLLSPIKTLGR